MRRNLICIYKFSYLRVNLTMRKVILLKSIKISTAAKTTDGFIVHGTS